MSINFRCTKKKLVPQDTTQYYTIRVSNIPKTTSDEEVLHEFGVYGNIVEFTRPLKLDKHEPTSYAFIKYEKEEDMINAIMNMDHRYCFGEFNEILVQEANQDSFFTNQTGGLTNYNIPPKQVDDDSFDSSMPKEHYIIKRQKQLANANQTYTIRVDDLHPSITKEKLLDMFAVFGEISSIYFPVNLSDHCRPRGFAFIRYLSERDAIDAVEHMHEQNLGVGRNIQVRLSYTKNYFSQDETGSVQLPRKKGLAFFIDP